MRNVCMYEINMYHVNVLSIEGEISDACLLACLFAYQVTTVSPATKVCEMSNPEYQSG